jgi:hypothetical protein
LLSKAEHANHSFQPCIFDCSCTVIMYTICCVLWYYSSALLRVDACWHGNHANHSSSCTSLIVAVTVNTICCVAMVLQQCAAACVH